MTITAPDASSLDAAARPNLLMFPIHGSALRRGASASASRGSAPSSEYLNDGLTQSRHPRHPASAAWSGRACFTWTFAQHATRDLSLAKSRLVFPEIVRGNRHPGHRCRSHSVAAMRGVRLLESTRPEKTQWRQLVKTASGWQSLPSCGR
jgi:hypothetical protein